jgi:uncharacterized membrane protein YsdA (DUF1294 family)
MQITLPSETIFFMLTIYILIINLVAFSVMWWDKRKAKKDDWRVSEATLLILSFIGGAIGFFLGMFRFRHKTKKRLFQVLGIIGLIFSLLLYVFTISLWVQL